MPSILRPILVSLIASFLALGLHHALTITPGLSSPFAPAPLTAQERDRAARLIVASWVDADLAVISLSGTCPARMAEATALQGRFPLGLPSGGTNGQTRGNAYGSGQSARRGGTAASVGGSHSHTFSAGYTLGSGSHGHSGGSRSGSGTSNSAPVGGHLGHTYNDRSEHPTSGAMVTGQNSISSITDMQRTTGSAGSHSHDTTVSFSGGGVTVGSTSLSFGSIGIGGNTGTEGVNQSISGSPPPAPFRTVVFCRMGASA